MHNLKNMLAAAMLFSFSTFNAQASLSVTANGLGVYDSGLNATWTQDANLLGTLETAFGYETIVNAIITAAPVVYDTPNYHDGSFNNYDGDKSRPYSGTYTLSALDFLSGGRVDWFAAQAYVRYLNSLNNGEGYGGTNHWALPTQPNQNGGNNITNSQLGELYYNELNALAVPGTNAINFGILHDGTTHTFGNAGPFTNAQTDAYWSGTEYTSNADNAWLLRTNLGTQEYASKNSVMYAWAVSPGQLSAVPIPGAVWLFSIGMLGLLGLKRRVHT